MVRLNVTFGNAYIIYIIALNLYITWLFNHHYETASVLIDLHWFWLEEWACFFSPLNCLTFVDEYMRWDHFASCLRHQQEQEARPDHFASCLRHRQKQEARPAEINRRHRHIVKYDSVLVATKEHSSCLYLQVSVGVLLILHFLACSPATALFHAQFPWWRIQEPKKCHLNYKTQPLFSNIHVLHFWFRSKSIFCMHLRNFDIWIVIK